MVVSARVITIILEPLSTSTRTSQLNTLLLSSLMTTFMPGADVGSDGGMARGCECRVRWIGLAVSDGVQARLRDHLSRIF